jgi:PEP-CTERM motif
MALHCFAAFRALAATAHHHVNHAAYRLVRHHGYRLHHVIAHSGSLALPAMVCVVTGLAAIGISSFVPGGSNVHRFIPNDVGQLVTPPVPFDSGMLSSQPDPLPWFDSGEIGGLQSIMPPVDPSKVGDLPDPRSLFDTGDADGSADPPSSLDLSEISGSLDTPPQPSPVPEPTSISVLGIGLLALAVARRPKRDPAIKNHRK